MEILDIVDEENNLIGRQEEREIVHRDGLRHREVGVIVINNKNEILIEKRAATKKQSPNKWSLCAGHITAGDTPENAIVREISEEIGIDVSLSELKFMMTVKRDRKISDIQYNNAFMYIFILKTNKKIEEYKVQEEELSEVKYFSIEEIEMALENKDEKYAFVEENYMKDIIEKLKGDMEV